MQDWDDNGPPSIFWLSGFFFVQSFLTAGLQNYARKHKIPIDMVEYDHVMLQMNPATYSAPPEEGFYVHGLFLEGCQWDEQQLQLRESSPKVSLKYGKLAYVSSTTWLFASSPKTAS